MDTQVESDILVQRAATELLKDLQVSLRPLLYQVANVSGASNLEKPRSYLDTRELDRVLKLLDTFQEAPQLLDPVIAGLLDILTATLVECLPLLKAPENVPGGATALPLGTCRLLYSFCKVRGQKVIIRFLNNEARYIAPLIEALECRATISDAETDSLAWEEKYVLLLWLSHLVITPFPIISAGVGSEQHVTLSYDGWTVPEDMPFVKRLCTIGHYYLGSSSKERDASVNFLVRLVLRPDMQRAGLLENSIVWTKSQLEEVLQSDPISPSDRSLYHILGVLSFLARLFNSADPSSIAKHLLPIFRLVKNLHDADDESKESISLSAVGRKLVIKIYRSSVLAAIQLSNADEGTYGEIIEDILEDAIGDLLASLGDQDAPVRFAASKALSVVTTKLQTDMAMEVIESVIAGLDEGVLWLGNPKDEQDKTLEDSSRRRDVSLVNPFRWQGLTLTLAHLLFRRAPSTSLLPSVINALILALSFEQRSTTGASIGNTVRDAANFGIWSLARRYSSTEILAVKSKSIQAASTAIQGQHALQLIACELVCTACFDPSGNIRRGASAALQELIGRHPDTISQGINIVQTVDYHAVSLLAKSVTRVALDASRLSEEYRQRLMAELMGWRGVYAVDASTRRLAAQAIGSLAFESGEKILVQVINFTWENIQRIERRDIGNRHGLLLALAELIAALLRRIQEDSKAHKIREEIIDVVGSLWQICEGRAHLDEDSFTNFSLWPSLTAEAFCVLFEQLLLLTSFDLRAKPSHAALRRAISFVELSASLKEEVAYARAAGAATRCLQTQCLEMILYQEVADGWLSRASQTVSAGPGRQSSAPGWLCLTSSVYEDLSEQEKRSARQVFVTALGSKNEIETRIAALESLRKIIGSTSSDSTIIQSLQERLRDYTTDQRGDIGSLARIGALKCVKELPDAWHSEYAAESKAIQKSVGVLAAEKLDKVRSAASDCLYHLLQKTRGQSAVTSLGKYLNQGGVSSNPSDSSTVRADVSSEKYFHLILQLGFEYELSKPVLLGLASTISGASESTSEAARAALEDCLVAMNAERLNSFLGDLVSVLSEHLNDERNVTPIIETIALVMETRTLSSVYAADEASASFKLLFASVQKAHFKSTLIPKLMAAVELYTNLAAVKCLRTSILKKLLGMLVHPFPKVRQGAAEGLLMITMNETLLPVDWTRPPTELKPHVEKTRRAILAS